MADIFELYSKAGKAFGPSGREDAARQSIEALGKPYVDEAWTDTLGNLILRKRGRGKKIMLCAHMDTIGFVATHIEKGIIRFAPVGGVSVEDILNASIQFENGTAGIVAWEEKIPKKDMELEHLFLDIGAGDEEAVRRNVQVGDFAVFGNAPFRQDGCICGPYLDNRIGCAALLKALEYLTETDNDLYFVFSVQEEVGLRGAGPAAFAIAPDYAIAVDVTDTGDLPERKYPMAVKLGAGPAVKVMDKSVITAEVVRSALLAAGKALSIPLQTEILRFGGTDTAAIQRTRDGVLSGAVSIPTRYIHTPHEMVWEGDVLAAARLLAHTVCAML